MIKSTSYLLHNNEKIDMCQAVSRNMQDSQESATFRLDLIVIFLKLFRLVYINEHIKLN